jgi:hypothetical protein
MVSTTDPYGRNLDFPDRRLIFTGLFYPHFKSLHVLVKLAIIGCASCCAEGIWSFSPQLVHLMIAS